MKILVFILAMPFCMPIYAIGSSKNRPQLSSDKEYARWLNKNLDLLHGLKYALYTHKDWYYSYPHDINAMIPLIEQTIEVEKEEYYLKCLRLAHEYLSKNLDKILYVSYSNCFILYAPKKKMYITENENFCEMLQSPHFDQRLKVEERAKPAFFDSNNAPIVQNYSLSDTSIMASTTEFNEEIRSVRRKYNNVVMTCDSIFPKGMIFEYTTTHGLMPYCNGYCPTEEEKPFLSSLLLCLNDFTSRYPEISRIIFYTRLMCNPKELSPSPGADIQVSEAIIAEYSGMPIEKTRDGQAVFSSARDIGNITVGYVAGSDGMSWKASRIAFDTYQSKVGGRLTMEGISTRNAEYYGWSVGSNIRGQLYHIYC